MTMSRSIWRRATAAGCEDADVATSLCSMLRTSVLLQVEDAGAGAQFFQHAARARVMRPLVDFRILVEQIAEHDRLARARLRARGGHVALADSALLVLGDVARMA